ncbi:plastocyanin [Aequorivita sp. F47161]|jgi:plastocyanin|uniref:Plastocyanin n=1 Tax=Aequorivita vitellina TaxID=2874475 RepID=A0A9X1QXK4_9FLAO|nr:plastocyanin/azurin family copper-binding protein [Aequorivita vitellina]MCG2418948.1 plastocyanin [Aequorivita vitellina]MCZ4319616.1 plastocyanin/azurin family copper-binding protein [Aequorivita viscosa]
MKTFQKSVAIFSTLSLVLIGVFVITSSFKSESVNTTKAVTHVVTIHQMKFDPQNIVVNKGDIVAWVNKDIVPHDVTEINKKWTSKPMNPGDKFSKVITEDFNYFCSLHVIMKGSVAVKSR